MTEDIFLKSKGNWAIKESVIAFWGEDKTITHEFFWGRLLMDFCIVMNSLMFEVS